MISCALLPLLLVSPSLRSPQPVPSAAPVTVQDNAEAEAEGWSGSVTAGALLSTGNSETRNATVTAEAEWTRGVNKFNTSALWNYQSDQGGISQRKLYGQAKFDHFYGEKFYSYSKASADQDLSADLDLRAILGVGMGNEFISNDAWLLSGEGGLSYLAEDFSTAPADANDGYLAARLAYTATYTGSDAWEFSHGGEVYPSLEDGDDVYARFVTNAKTNLTETLYAQFQWVYDYDNTPAPGNDRNDSLFALTLGWKF